MQSFYKNHKPKGFSPNPRGEQLHSGCRRKHQAAPTWPWRKAYSACKMKFDWKFAEIPHSHKSSTVGIPNEMLVCSEL